MNKLRRSRFFLPLLLIGLALLVTAGFVVIYSSAAPLALDITADGSTIQFSASRPAVLFPGDCVTLRWNVQNTAGVFVNDELLPAEGEKPLCVDATIQPVIRVLLLNDAGEAIHPLNVMILALNPLFVTGAVAVMAMLGAGIFLLLQRAKGYITHMEMLQTAGWVTLMTLFGVGVAVAVLEGALRVYFSNSGTREQKIMYLYSLEEVRALQTSIRPMPYVSYVPSPDYTQDGNNRLGYRGEVVAIPKPDGVFRIVAMGGSTTYSTGTTAEDAYPALLQKILRETYGYENVEVVNAGVMGYTSWEMLAAFEFRVLELQPDMLIVYEAVNDLVVRERSDIDCYQGENILRGLNPWRGLFVERNAPYPPSTLYRFVAISLGWMPNPLALDSSFEPVSVACEPEPEGTDLARRLENNPPVYFERNIRNLMLLAQGNGVQPVISSWAYNVESNRPQLWRDNIALHNRITKDIAEEFDLPYYDLAGNFPVNADFWEQDGIHMVTAGTTEQAKQYAAFLDESGLIPKP